MTKTTPLQLAQSCAQAILNIKGADIAIYDLRGISSITDFSIICTANSVPHLRAIIRDIEKDILEELAMSPVYVENTPNALWSVIDYIDVMVHVMSEEMRAFYQVDTLWKGAKRIEVDA